MADWRSKILAMCGRAKATEEQVMEASKRLAAGVALPTSWAGKVCEDDLSRLVEYYESGRFATAGDVVLPAYKPVPHRVVRRCNTHLIKYDIRPCRGFYGEVMTAVLNSELLSLYDLSLRWPDGSRKITEQDRAYLLWCASNPASADRWAGAPVGGLVSPALWFE